MYELISSDMKFQTELGVGNDSSIDRLRRLDLAHIRFPASDFNGRQFSVLGEPTWWAFLTLPELPPNLGRLRKLSFLTLRASTELRSLTGLSELPELTHLDLSGSEFVTLPEDIGTLAHLQLLNISRITRLETLPETLFSLSDLRELSLVGNVSMRSIPAKVRCLKNLERLHLDHCRLVATLPEELTHLSNLEHLGLSGCPLLFVAHQIHIDAQVHCHQAFSDLLLGVRDPSNLTDGRVRLATLRYSESELRDKSVAQLRQMIFILVLITRIAT